MFKGGPCSHISYLLALAIIVVSACAREEQPVQEREDRTLDFEATITFMTDEPDTISTIRAAVADDDASRSEGLMDVHNLPQDRGMIFIFDDEQERSFWMANTPLSLDIIFADAEGRIVRIHQNTQPFSDRNILSEEPAKYAVETNAGYTLRNDILEGMYISYDY